MAYRRLLKYPPGVHMLVVLIQSEDYGKATASSEEIEKGCKALAAEFESGTFSVIGPCDCTIGRINNVYRRVIYIKAERMDVINKVRQLAEEHEAEGVSVSTDIDPLNSY